MSLPRSSSSSSSEHIYVLYGSQTGNAEQVAKDFCAQIPTKLSPASIEQLLRTSNHTMKTTTNDNSGNTAQLMIPQQVTASHMQLDDFLELEQCRWTRLVVIITSSYGIGQAPLGCYRFRDLCDAWIELRQRELQQHPQQPPKGDDDADNALSSSLSKTLSGVKYALCGLGDSKYTTYFRNPSTIDAALQIVGAERIGELGKADASGIGERSQSKVIEEWVNGIWIHLATALVEQPTVSQERLVQMQQDTIALCRKINPEFPNPDDANSRSTQKTTTTRITFILTILVAILAIVMGYYVFQR